ncbi:uncharacterized protein LOC119074853 [Bradysia coprophila]|uniref:uncharacterized protein LOC119074853 n=1 Tax=Bradysia coprophila TaxID=38358 RepID=UPI00187DA0F4|nr:uncharacterized protein LOC119074853 [Bradysia coprophila]
MTLETDDHFNDTLNDAIGFDSTWNTNRSIKVVSRQIGTDELPTTKDQSSTTEAAKSIGTQTEYAKNFGQVNEQELAKWLRDIYPMVEKEIQQGITNVFDFSKFQLSDVLSFQPTQTISAIDKNLTENLDAKSLIHGCACWLSVSTQNAPLIAIASSYSHDVWCNHSSAVKVFQPIRNKANGSVNYQELKTLPVKSCINSLVTNPHNKDIFAGGTFSGDLYIWKYEIRSDGGIISEHFSETSQFGGNIVGITWMKANAASRDFDLLTGHVDGVIVLWKVGKVLVKDKIFKIKSLNDSDELAVLSSIVSFSRTDFIVGTEEGRVLLCSLAHSQSNETFYDPVINELEPHTFAVPTLIHSNYRDQAVIVSCDVSGVVCFRWIGESSDLWKTVKMPMPFKGKICCTQNLEHLLSAGQDGTLDVFTIATEIRKTFQGHLIGPGDAISISENGCWIVTGCYQGLFKLFELQE